jgi:hypothetical protein
MWLGESGAFAAEEVFFADLSAAETTASADAGIPAASPARLAHFRNDLLFMYGRFMQII